MHLGTWIQALLFQVLTFHLRNVFSIAKWCWKHKLSHCLCECRCYSDINITHYSLASYDLFFFDSLHWYRQYSAEMWRLWRNCCWAMKMLTPKMQSGAVHFMQRPSAVMKISFRCSFLMVHASMRRTTSLSHHCTLLVVKAILYVAWSFVLNVFFQTDACL